MDINEATACLKINLTLMYQNLVSKQNEILSLKGIRQVLFSHVLLISNCYLTFESKSKQNEKKKTLNF